VPGSAGAACTGAPAERSSRAAAWRGVLRNAAQWMWYGVACCVALCDGCAVSAAARQATLALLHGLVMRRADLKSSQVKSDALLHGLVMRRPDLGDALDAAREGFEPRIMVDMQESHRRGAHL
jgi:hypothetical protein